MATREGDPSEGWHVRPITLIFIDYKIKSIVAAWQEKGERLWRNKLLQLNQRFNH
jgi:hypothetical protein